MRTFLALYILSALSLHAASIFVPENGKFAYNLAGITQNFKNHRNDYVTLRSEYAKSGEVYKLDAIKNEYQIRNYYQRDLFKLQDMFVLNSEAYIKSQNAKTFNEAKRTQYSKYIFNHKKLTHQKTTPAMKEWGGLTHPPVKKLTMPLHKYDENFGAIDYRKISSPYFNPALQLDIDQVSRSELSFGNTVKALADHDAFLAKKRLIKNATTTIFMSSLVFVCDKSTRELVELLIDKHHEGVDVKIIADGTVGKILGHRECFELMRNAGINVIETKDFFKHKLKAIYHTKTLVVDFREAIAGGQNMLDADNLSRGTDFQNRDIDLYIKGPMVSDVTKQFLENWAYQVSLNPEHPLLLGYEFYLKQQMKLEREQGLRGQNLYARILNNPETRMKGVCRFIKQAPYEDRHTIGKAYLKLLPLVNKHLVITDPVKSDTYTPDPLKASITDKLDNFDMFNQLHLATQSLARKGKKIDYITTNINMAGNENVAMMNDRIKEQLGMGKDMAANISLLKIVLTNDYFGIPHYENLLKDWYPHKSVHIWKHLSFMHSKIFYFDRVVSSVGSLNFQHNATDQAYESTTICMDEKLNAELDQILVQDMANSIPLIFQALK
ncbi:phospholipase D-like domain-containing protein [Peredibacter starrii]|uniref:Phosphatidylserine/phosphatidylglycerophosphate/ cardiolipin synthase family protein n=1 Tax=Peredibacter starrii TaxID=28202 RepID=A0AAX4HJ23_9BACT|nr:phosphatidylserine/phosphatidylglycerophosphate/cardiolipin synthase family protein [Peredibacter starrii]WPU63231.1 phosphatidylserine/phosphatidylglycerophosphate/cardiolipin synthase family protein [Peredibacter starrii]